MMAGVHGAAAIEVDGPAQGLRRARGRARHRLRRRARRGVRAARARTARARRRRSRSSRATARARRRRCRVLGHDPGDRPADLRERVGIVLQSCGTYPHLTRARDGRALGIAVSGAARRRRGRRARRSRGGRRPPRAHAVGRPAAAARPGAGAGRRPRAGVPRRADDGLRPGRAARGVGHGPLAARRSARPCCSPPTTSTRRRRSPTAWRSSRTARSWPRARPASWARPAARYRVTYRGGEHVTDDPTALLHELTAAALARGERLEDLRSRGRRSRTSTWS